MTYSTAELWARFQKYYTEFPDIGLTIDLSRMNFADNYFESTAARMAAATSAMADLEKGKIANPDENRMVGHYWLRNPALAPSADIKHEIEETVARIKEFAAQVHSGKVKGAKGPFKNVLLIGIGGSALGPQFVSHALGHPSRDKVSMFFFDNTDPDGMDTVLAAIGPELSQTLTVVVSKSGGTKETRNGMLEAEAAYKAAGLEFGKHGVAVTSQGSELDKHAAKGGWITTFPMWDWVGGRTSELSAVGLLPAALQGIDVDAMLAGAKSCDDITRSGNVNVNPAAQMALMWFYIGNGKGEKNMVVLPYKDRLELFSKYLQQLIMESLGKEKDLNGKVVHQGITVLGNKGSTDQHSYIQQLRDGLSNFFVTFIEVLKDRAGASAEMEPLVTSGDYLVGFFLGTRRALYESGRQSVTLTVNEVSPFSVGVLIALFERTVGLYATLVNVNAYHQPGVEAGKKAASTVIDLQRKALEYLTGHESSIVGVAELAAAIQARDEVETLFKICEHLAANGRIKRTAGGKALDAKYQSC